MGLTYKKTDKLEKMLEDFIVLPEDNTDKQTDAQKEAEKFLKKEQEVLDNKKERKQK